MAADPGCRLLRPVADDRRLGGCRTERPQGNQKACGTDHAFEIPAAGDYRWGTARRHERDRPPEYAGSSTQSAIWASLEFAGAVAIDDRSRPSDIGGAVRFFIFTAEPDPDRLVKIEGQPPRAGFSTAAQRG